MKTKKQAKSYGGKSLFKESGHEFNPQLTNKQVGMCNPKPSIPSNMVPGMVGGSKGGKSKGY
jgi:hypothetical protein